MKRHWSQIAGMPVVCENQSRPLAFLSGVFVDPEKGKILAFRASFKKVFSPLDIAAWHSNHLEVDSPEALTLPEEISRLKNFGLKRSLLSEKKVRTKEGKKLGSLQDFCLETSTASILTLDVSRRFLFWEWDERTFPYSDVCEITEREIILNIEPEEKVKHKEKVSPKNAVRLSPASTSKAH